MPIDDRLRAELALLNRRFAEDLPRRLAAARAGWDAWSAGDDDGFATLLTAVHYLAGSGATFGRPDVSEAAAVLEALLQPWRGRDGRPDAATAAAIAEALAALEAGARPSP